MRLIDADAFDEWLQKHEEAAAALEAADSDVFVDKDRKTYYSTQSFRDVMRYRPTINRAKKVVHFHQEFPEHDWARDEDGKIDEFAMEYEYHNGPYCNRCGYSFCIHCTPAVGMLRDALSIIILVRHAVSAYYAHSISVTDADRSLIGNEE